MRRKLSLTATGAGIVTLAAVIMTLAGVFAASAAPYADVALVDVGVKTTTEGTVTIYDVSITNNATKGIAGYEIRAAVPQGGKFVGASPSTFKFENATVIWVSARGIDPGKTAAGFQFKVDGASASPTVNVKYWGPIAGAASAGPGAAAPGQTTTTTTTTATTPAATATPEPPRRGCSACHVLVDKVKGNYTLGWEAEERAKADYGVDHPVVAPSGAKVDKLTESNVAACLECHKPSKENPGRGVGAPITLRDIVHPAHMFSAAFKEHYNGSCFTCHNVGGDGTYYLLSEKVDVNEKGVPKALLAGKGSIPGQIAPSER